jgi:hypothetical protein
MKRVISWLLVLFLQSASLSSTAHSQPILQVRVSTVDLMLSLSPINYLHLRVFGDGRVEIEDRQETETRFVLRKKTLTADELSLLKKFLHNSAVLELPTTYAPAFAPIDHRTTITISIDRGEKLQTIQITNYNVALGKDKGLYSQTLIDLMCRIERVRGNASYQPTANGWCSSVSETNPLAQQIVGRERRKLVS